jgi:hypothetical protein
MKEGVYEVWHPKEEVQGTTMVNFPRDYELVARVQARYIEEAFGRSNDPGPLWWRHRDVECLKETRTTTVNDVIVCPDQRVFLAFERGWRCIHDPTLGQTLERTRAEQALEQRPKLGIDGE